MNWFQIWKEEMQMVKLYLRKINEGKITIDDVPLLWREKVRKEIEG